MNIVVEAHLRRRLRSRIVAQQKSPRNLFNKLVKQGLSRYLASATSFTNKKKWALSHTPAVERGYSNRWFIKIMNLKIRLEEKHWFDTRKWIRLT